MLIPIGGPVYLLALSMQALAGVGVEWVCKGMEEMIKFSSLSFKKLLKVAI